MIATKPGQIRIDASMRNGSKQSFYYDATYLPPINLQLENANGQYSKTINVAELKTGCLLNVQVPGGSLYDDYSIVEFSLVYNGQTYEMTGNDISFQKIPGLTPIRQGDTFLITKVALNNQTTGKKIAARFDHLYQIE